MSATAVLARTGNAEWHRIWSVRSSWLFALVTTVAVLGLGMIIGADAADDPSAVTPGSTAWDGARATAMFALFGVLALSVVTATADHGTRGIVPTLQWTPRRGLLYGARAAVIIATTTLLGVLLVAAAGLVILVSVPDLGLQLGDGAEVLGGLAFVLAAGSALAVGVGVALRSTAGGLVTVIALVLVLPPLVAQLPYDMTTTIAEHLPGSGALFLIFGEGPSDDTTTTSARVTLAVWGVAALAAGAFRLLRTDAD